jgi:hypothetical protein
MSENGSGRDRPRSESPWYCPGCRSWNGWKLETCLGCDEGRPRLPLRYDDVAFDDSRKVTLRHRIRGKLQSLRAVAVLEGGESGD